MTIAELPSDARKRIDDLARAHAEWRPWLAVVEEALRAALDPAWAAALGDLAPSPEGAWLTSVELPVGAKAAGHLVKRLLEIAGEAPGAGALREASRARALAPVALIEAAINQDEPRLAQEAAALGADARALAAVASLAAMPLLWASRRALEGSAARVEGAARVRGAARVGDAARVGGVKGSAGHCPVCAAWPTLAELRGLDRARQLRCGRCGADYAMQALVCVYCGESDHARLGALVPEVHGEARKVEVCHSCRGYIKTVTTLSAVRPELLPLEDLATVDLDLVALERGYARPERSGPPGRQAPVLSVRVVERAPARRGLLGWLT